MSKQLAKETQNLLYLEHTAKHCSSGVNVSFNLILLNQSLPAGSISETCKTQTLHLCITILNYLWFFFIISPLPDVFVSLDRLAASLAASCPRSHCSLGCPPSLKDPPYGCPPYGLDWAWCFAAMEHTTLASVSARDNESHACSAFGESHLMSLRPGQLTLTRSRLLIAFLSYALFSILKLGL